MHEHEKPHVKGCLELVPCFQASLVRERMLAGRSAGALQDSRTTEWCWGAIAATVSNVAIVGCLAAARSVSFHGQSLRGLGQSVVTRAWNCVTALMEPVKEGRYPLGSCGAAATTLVLAATVGDFMLRLPPSPATRVASELNRHAEQQLTSRLRRQCTLILLLILGMARVGSVACTNWAAAYAAALVSVPCAIAACKVLG